MKAITLFLSLAVAGAVLTSCGNTGKNAAKESDSTKVCATTASGAACSEGAMSEGGCGGCAMAGAAGCGASAAEGWVSLFDGKTTAGWRGYNMTAFPDKNWNIADSALHCLGVGKGDMTNTDLITEKKYGNFELALEWKVSKGGNSGIFIMTQEIPGVEIYKSSPEMQVLDNQNHPDGKLGKDGNHQAGSLYDMIPAKPQNAKPAGEWNQVRIMVYNGKVVFNQNGVNVVEFTLGSEEWKKMCENSKFKEWEWFVNTAKTGHIGLQDHGFEVWYRNIKIREL